MFQKFLEYLLKGFVFVLPTRETTEAQPGCSGFYFEENLKKILKRHYHICFVKEGVSQEFNFFFQNRKLYIEKQKVELKVTATKMQFKAKLQ